MTCGTTKLMIQDMISLTQVLVMELGISLKLFGKVRQKLVVVLQMDGSAADIPHQETTWDNSKRMCSHQFERAIATSDIIMKKNIKLNS